jgi:hypothetical protein
MRKKSDNKGRGRMPRSTRNISPAESSRDSGRECEVCGNEYDKAIEIVVNGISHYFDSFECAIHALAPRCEHCDCRIIGHGVEAGGVMFCCAHCAEMSGVHSLKDRV